MLQKETIEEFEARSYLKYSEDKMFVWPTLKVKKDVESNIKPEVWDKQTAKNYIKYLEE